MDASQPHHKLQYYDDSILFPFQPYKCQVEFIGKVVGALNSGTNALLESPTGTGKTLCLLTSTFGWVDAPTTSNIRIASTQKYTSPILPKTKPGQKPIIKHVYYCSRTHSQLKQVVSELRATAYRPSMSILGSRAQFCIHPKVKNLRGTIQDSVCRAFCDRRQCMYYNGFQDLLRRQEATDTQTKKGQNISISASTIGLTSPFDIEDVVKYSEEHRVCPYFLTRQMHRSAQLVFLPYNYIVDCSSHKPMNIEIENSVVIFDEGHNIEKVLCDASSFEFTSSDISSCINEVNVVISLFNTHVEPVLRGIAERASAQRPSQGANTPSTGAQKSDRLNTITIKDLGVLRQIFTKIEGVLDALKVGPQGLTLTPQKLFLLFKDAMLTPETFPVFADFVSKYVAALGEVISTRNESFDSSDLTGDDSSDIVDVSGDQPFEQLRKVVKRGAIHLFGSAMEVLFRRDAGMGFKVHVWDKEHQSRSQFQTTRPQPGAEVNRTTLIRHVGFWCFDPSVSMQDIVGYKPHSIIITSGTLTPIAGFAYELGLRFPTVHVNSHVIESSQVFARVVSRSLRGTALNFSYQRRSSPGMLPALGELLIEVARTITGGILVFFPSYDLMDTCNREWSFNRPASVDSPNATPLSPHPVQFTTPPRASNTLPILTILRQYKSVFFEPRSSQQLKPVYSEYMDSIGLNKPGGVLFGVCRGKLSEGLDFSDESARCVVIVGIPFSNRGDAKVRLKMEYMNERRSMVLSQKPELRDRLLRSDGNADVVIDGDGWYKLQAMRAVNQSIGRVVRHKLDFGSILLVDERYQERVSDLSGWVRDALSQSADFDDDPNRDTETMIRKMDQWVHALPQQIQQYRNTTLQNPNKHASVIASMTGVSSQTPSSSFSRGFKFGNTPPSAQPVSTQRSQPFSTAPLTQVSPYTSLASSGRVGSLERLSPGTSSLPKYPQRLLNPPASSIHSSSQTVHPVSTRNSSSAFFSRTSSHTHSSSPSQSPSPTIADAPSRIQMEEVGPISRLPLTPTEQRPSRVQKLAERVKKEAAVSSVVTPQKRQESVQESNSQTPSSRSSGTPSSASPSDPNLKRSTSHGRVVELMEVARNGLTSDRLKEFGSLLKQLKQSPEDKPLIIQKIGLLFDTATQPEQLKQRFNSLFRTSL
ncbi:putative Regulator of telomere elongation helicase 1 [Blattamonas nauphoetae]|uniref:Regulator of telomere elongation helicase 1 n=1 Tax=Blattamonas nauphoetae TaxID=2049346 RepID=A0ABQ9Y236_9EUKA|nr:putative Regulator of telomere elongation helicase 1 [Blattamonas nauphoetae]